MSLSCEALVSAPARAVPAPRQRSPMRVSMCSSWKKGPTSGRGGTAVVIEGIAADVARRWFDDDVGGTPIAFAEGRCVGGGTEINSAIFQRAPDDVIEGWATANHLHDFSPQMLMPFYDRAAAVVNASLTPGPAGPPTEILRRASKVMGWKTTALERGRQNHLRSITRYPALRQGAGNQ